MSKEETCPCCGREMAFGLKPCPFCGGKANMKKFITGSFVECPACEQRTPIYVTKAEAAKAWNRRVGEGNPKEDPNA